MFRKETVWVYSEDSEIRKKVRQFKFERTLKFLGMHIHVDGITLPDAIDQFRFKTMFSDISQNLNYKLPELEMKLNYMELLIQNTNSLLTVLKDTTDINKYLDIIDVLKHKFVIMLTVKDTPGSNLSASTIDKIKKIGFTNFTNKLWVMYVGMIGMGKVIYDNKANSPEDKIELIDFDVTTGTKFELKSQSWRNGNKAEILIDGVDYAANIRGINLVVFDLESKCIIDSIGYDAHTLDSRFIRKSIS